MNRVDRTNHRYEAYAALSRYGVELVAAADPVGARLNSAVRKLIAEAERDGADYWEDLLGWAKALRWRLVTGPQPVRWNPALREAAEQVRAQVQSLTGALGGSGQHMLSELAEAAAAAAESDPAVGAVLMQSIGEVGADDCTVVAENAPARSGLEGWPELRGVRVRTAAQLVREDSVPEQVYFVGPPRIFPASVVEAPATGEVSFLLPSWFNDRSLPRSAFSQHAEGASPVRRREFPVGEESAPEADESEAPAEDHLRPEPIWRSPATADRIPHADEVEARKLVLAGGWAVWLDNGEYIRTLDPLQPPEERVVFTDLRAVQAGTYLLLRAGETEHGAALHAALELMGPGAADVADSQTQWKDRLRQRLEDQGYGPDTRMLKNLGIKAHTQAPAWTDRLRVRPQRDRDFELLLEWLDIPHQPTFGNATRLRRLQQRASVEIRRQLEQAVAHADLSKLDREGYLQIGAQNTGFRQIIATRVLAASPYSEIIPRSRARVLLKDRSAPWLQ